MTDFNGSCTFGGVPFQRKWVDVWAIEEFLVKVWPKMVIELGTGTGSFSTYLASYCAFHDYAFHTFDLKHRSQHPHVRQNPKCVDAIRKLGGVVHDRDIFDPGTQEMIHKLLVSDSPAFLYCDNGDKPREVAAYCQMLKPGDFLGVHDFGTEIVERDLPQESFALWNPDSFANLASSNRILERIDTA